MKTVIMTFHVASQPEVSSMTDLKVYYEDNHLLVVEKPENMPTCEDESKDYDLLS